MKSFVESYCIHAYLADYDLPTACGPQELQSVEAGETRLHAACGDAWLRPVAAVRQWRGLHVFGAGHAAVPGRQEGVMFSIVVIVVIASNDAPMFVSHKSSRVPTHV